MPAVNTALRERLKNRQQSLSSSFIIENKTFTKGVYRILRNYDTNEEPGFKYQSYYSKQLECGTASPENSGLKCPIADYLTNLKNTAGKDDNDIAWKSVQPSTEYWIAVLDMENLGDAEKPGLRIFRAKRTVYDLILQQMLDADAGSDVCDLEEGRDCVIRKTGAMLDTKWQVSWKSDAAISDDADFVEAVRKVANELSVPSKFYAVDWDKLGQLYTNLTGEEMPAHYREQEGAESPAKSKASPAAKGKVAPAAKAKAAPAKAKPAPQEDSTEQTADEPADAGAGGDPAEGIVVGTTRVSFVGESGDTVEGRVVGYTAEGEEYDVEDAGGEIWSMGLTDFTVLEDAPAPKAGPKKKVAAPAPAATKAAPAKAAPAKAAVPNKPASGGIRSKLAGR